MGAQRLRQGPVGRLCRILQEPPDLCREILRLPRPCRETGKHDPSRLSTKKTQISSNHFNYLLMFVMSTVSAHFPHLSFIRYTGPSYQNESSDSVSRKPLDAFQNAFNTKQVFIFDGGFVTTILSNSTIYSTFLIDLSILMQCPFLIPCCNKVRATAKQHRAWQCFLHARCCFAVALTLLQQGIKKGHCIRIDKSPM